MKWAPQRWHLVHNAFSDMEAASMGRKGGALQPGGVSFFGGFPGCEGEGFEDGFFFRGVESVSVYFDEKRCCDETGAFVSIEERVVFDDAVCVGGRHLKNAWLSIGKEVLGPIMSGIEKGFIPDTR